jgi:hypothetical protein
MFIPKQSYAAARSLPLSVSHYSGLPSHHSARRCTRKKGFEGSFYPKLSGVTFEKSAEGVAVT